MKSGTFRRYDCPFISASGEVCKHKVQVASERHDLTPKQKQDAMRIRTCAGCEVYNKLNKGLKRE